jgi:hypothetical protein
MKIRIPIFTREPISSHITFLSKDTGAFYDEFRQSNPLHAGSAGWPYGCPL